MYLSQSLSFNINQSVKVRLSHKQKKTLSKLKLRLIDHKHPEIPDATKGFDGMLLAHSILQERNAVGIMIGGLAKTMWSMRRTPEQLFAHKDVDVLVLTKDFEIKKPFEGGIDWWLPHNGILNVRKDSGNIRKNFSWFQNGFNIVLFYRIEEIRKLNPGLYIMDPELVADTCSLEAEASIDPRVHFDDIGEVFDKFRKVTRSKMTKCLPSFIRKVFSKYIISDKYGIDDDSFKIESLEFDVISAIKRYNDKIAATH